jgi:hypothetical protein
MYLRRAVGQRGAQVEHGGQRIVVHVDGRRRVCRLVAVPCDHAGHGLADIPDLRSGHRRVVRDHGVLGDRPGARQAALLAGEVRAGEGGHHAGHGPGGGQIHPGDPRVRVRAAGEGHVQHAGQLDVIGPVRLAGDQPRVFLADAGPADLGRGLDLGVGAHEVAPAWVAGEDCTA